MIFALLLALSTGEEAIARYECNRCHTIPGIAPAPIAKSCAGCHTAIVDGTIARALGRDVEPATLARWRERITHYVEVPTLIGLDRRVRRSWVERFLLDPHDVRPGLGETMPRLPITREDARALATFLVPHEPDEGSVTWPTRTDGGALLEAKGCTECHRFTGALESRAPAPSLAPDLRHARERLTARSLIAWLEDPHALKSDAVMPRIPLTRDEAAQIARHLIEAPLAVAERARERERLPVLERAVRWPEVYERVFSRSCRHCHADPALAFADGGPGNTGGFGYRARGLSLASDTEANEGSLQSPGDPDGGRRSIFAPLAGTPRLLAHLLARREEERGGTIEGVIGMPLGLPALDDVDLQLVESWIAQGRPR